LAHEGFVVLGRELAESGERISVARGCCCQLILSNLTWRSCIIFQWYSRIFHGSKPDGISIGIGTIAGAVLLENGFWSEHIALMSGENQLTEFIVSNELTSMFDLARRLEVLKMEEILICCSRVLLPVGSREAILAMLPYNSCICAQVCIQHLSGRKVAFCNWSVQ
jgi:hypothetical protein